MQPPWLAATSPGKADLSSQGVNHGRQGIFLATGLRGSDQSRQKQGTCRQISYFEALRIFFNSRESFEVWLFSDHLIFCLFGFNIKLNCPFSCSQTVEFAVK